MMILDVTAEAGDSIEDACFHALMLARQLHVRVIFDFNERLISIHPRNEVPQLLAAFHSGKAAVLCAPVPD